MASKADGNEVGEDILGDVRVVDRTMFRRKYPIARAYTIPVHVFSPQYANSLSRCVNRAGATFD